MLHQGILITFRSAVSRLETQVDGDDVGDDVPDLPGTGLSSSKVSGACALECTVPLVLRTRNEAGG